MPRNSPARRARGVHILSQEDSFILTQGAVGIRIDASVGNLSMVFFYNADTGGLVCDVTSLYVYSDGAQVAQVGWFQGVRGTQEQQAQHSILNAAAPPIYAYQFLAASDPSNPIMHYGTENGAMITAPTGRMFRLPAGYSLVVRPRGANVGINASIIFNMRAGVH